MLKPQTAFGETTKFLEESFHADGRDETVSPPLLSAGVRNAMLRQFLDMKPGDVVLDLGCGSGRFCVWSLDSGAHVIGIDTGTFFAAEARASVDLVAGELRQLPFADASVTKAYTIDVLEHLSPEGLHATLREVSRVLTPGGSLFVYTHVRQRSPFAPVLGLIARTASAVERLGFADLTIEKLRKTDHSEPVDEPQHLDDVASNAGFRVADSATTRPCCRRSRRIFWFLSPPTRWRAKPRGTRSSDGAAPFASTAGHAGARISASNVLLSVARSFVHSG